MLVSLEYAMPAFALRATAAVLLLFAAQLHGADSSGGAGTTPPPPPPPAVHDHVMLGIAPASAPASGGTSLMPALSAPVVGQVVPGSTAAEMGLAVGDTITQIDGIPLSGWSELVEALSRHSPGDMISLTITRGTATLTLHGTLKARTAGAEKTPAADPPP